ncbi:MAG TPA: site-2 protease family protein, partial [Candidatus Acidoferrum sp.]|nr:site-2 protease family protein [Candidatus Acidoferrum sp.]
MSEGNGRTRPPVEILDIPFAAPPDYRPPKPPQDALWPALILFLLTVVSTLAVGAEFGLSYAQNREPFSGYQNPFALMLLPFQHPALLAMGIPFSFTLLLILFTHEMGHYVACRIYGINASYPYFIPAPTLFGTFGAFIRIRSPITTRRALFDVGLAGPVAGFLVALPALAYGVASSRIVPGAEASSAVVFGHPLLERLLCAQFHPRVDVTWLLLILFTHEMGHYVACRIYGIDASYPYFIPAPTLFGTFGAFIRIRSPITTRRALFDVGLAGPVAGFAVALPALAYGVATSQTVPGAEEASSVVFGHP